jgi:hypothetical protein
MVNMIRDVELIDGQMFLIFVRNYRVSLFLDCPLRILGGIMWMTQKEPLISNSKIFIMAYVGILYTCLGVTLAIFIMAEMGNLLER